MPLPRDDVERALEHKLGFKRDETDHWRFRLVIRGRQIVRTKSSHGTKYRELGDQLLALMARELQVSRGFFISVVRYTKSPEEYLDELARRGLLTAEERAAAQRR